MPFDLGLPQTAWIAAVMVLAGVIRGFSGFGFGAIVLAGTGLVTSPVHFVPVLVISDLVLTMGQARSIRTEIEWRRILWLAPGAVLAMPLGVSTVARMGDDAARFAISLLILVLTALLWAGWRARAPLGGPAHLGAGVVSGLAHGASLGGLPVAAFFAAQPISARSFRATIITYFFMIDIVALPLMARAGLVSADTLGATALCLPLMAFGVWVGSGRFRAAAPDDFRRFALLLLTVLALAGLGRSLL